MVRKKISRLKIIKLGLHIFTYTRQLLPTQIYLHRGNDGKIQLNSQRHMYVIVVSYFIGVIVTIARFLRVQIYFSDRLEF